MHTDHPEIHHKNRHLAERFEGLLGKVMVVAIALLVIGGIYMVMTADSTPSWMR